MKQLKEQVATLSPRQQRELTAHLVRLQNARDPQYKRLLAQWRDDRSRTRWLTLDEAEKQLAKN
jgi:hypothetical protein